MKKLALIVTSLAIIFVLSKALVYSPRSSASELKTTYEFIATRDGQTALELLHNQVDVAYAPEATGMTISGLGGLVNNDQRLWVMYVNGTPLSTDSGAVTLNSGDAVKFVFESSTPQ